MLGRYDFFSYVDMPYIYIFMQASQSSLIQSVSFKPAAYTRHCVPFLLPTFIHVCCAYVNTVSTYNVCSHNNGVLFAKKTRERERESHREGKEKAQREFD